MRKIGDVRQLLASVPPGREEPCYQGFASLTEVPVFCTCSYGIDTPPLYLKRAEVKNESPEMAGPQIQEGAQSDTAFIGTFMSVHSSQPQIQEGAQM